MQHRKLAFIGAGNMTRSIVAGLVASGYPKEAIIASNRSRPKLDALEEELGIKVTQSNDEACQFADAIVLSVKPQMMADVCAAMQQNTDFTGKLFVSIAAGLPVARLQEMLGGDYPVVRVMPNTPSLLGKGMSGLYADETVEQSDRDYVADVMGAVGKTLWVEKEDDIKKKILSLLALNKINEIIADEIQLGREKQIGHSYLLHLATHPTQFDIIWKYDIIPLLEEFFYAESKDLENILGKKIFDSKKGIQGFDTDELMESLEEIIKQKPDND